MGTTQTSGSGSIAEARRVGRDDVELIDYLLVLWRWKVLIVLGTVAAAATALAVSFALPKVYEATTTLMVARSKFGSEQMLGPQQVALTAKTYEGIVKNGGAMAEAIGKFQLGEPPHNYKVRDLERKVSVGVVKDTSLLTLSVESDDARRASDIANFLATRAIDLNNRLNEGEMGESRTFLDAQVNRSAASLDAAEKALETFTREADIEILRKEVETHLARLGDLEAQRSKTAVDLADASGDRARLEEDLRRQPKTITTSRTLVEDPAYQQALSKLSKSEAEGLLGVNMHNEQVNPTYSFIEEKLAESRRDVSGFTARKTEIERLLEQNNKELQQLQDELTEKTTQSERLKRSYELARDSFKTLRNRFEAASVEVVSKSSILKVVDPALPPQRHTRPRKAINTAIAGAVGCVAMVMLAFFVDYVQRVRVPK